MSHTVRGLPVPPDLAADVRALVVARGAERTVCLMGLSPTAVLALAAGAFAQAETLRRARHYFATGEALPKAPRQHARPPPLPSALRPPLPPLPPAAAPLPANVVPLRPRRA